MPLAMKSKRTLGATRDSEPVSSTEIVKQLHETGRHAFDLYVRWFTYFITLNFVALGWLAQRKDIESIDPVLALVVCISIIVFVILGAFSAGSVRSLLVQIQEELILRMKALPEAERYVSSSLPSGLYVKNLRIMTIALYFLLGVWIIILSKAI